VLPSSQGAVMTAISAPIDVVGALYITADGMQDSAANMVLGAPAPMAFEKILSLEGAHECWKFFDVGGVHAVAATFATAAGVWLGAARAALVSPFRVFGDDWVLNLLFVGVSGLILFALTVKSPRV
jgi:hypothetical protein